MYATHLQHRCTEIKVADFFHVANLLIFLMFLSPFRSGLWQPFRSCVWLKNTRLSACEILGLLNCSNADSSVMEVSPAVTCASQHPNTSTQDWSTLENVIVPRSLFIFWSFGLLEFLSSLILRTVVNLCVTINAPMAVNRSATTIKPAVAHPTMFTLPNPVIDSKTPDVVLMGIMQNFRHLLSLVSGVQFKLTQWQCHSPGIVYPAFDYLDVLILFSYYTRSQNCVMLVLLIAFLLSL